MKFLRHIWHWWQQFLSPAQSSQKNPKILILEPILTPSSLFDLDVSDGIFSSDRQFLEHIDRNFLDEYSMLGTTLEEIISEFIAGFFTVGDTGNIEIDFLFNGWNYQGEVAIFNLAGMEKFGLETNAFIQEAAFRSASHSRWGYTLTRDRLQASCDRDAKTLTMQPGDRFGIMFVPKGTVEELLRDPQLENTSRPLFSLATDNFADEFHFGQIIDLTGEGDTFMVEDLRLDGALEGDLLLKVRGAIGEAPTIDALLDSMS